jgi:hypothetical protein
VDTVAPGRGLFGTDETLRLTIPQRVTAVPAFATRTSLGTDKSETHGFLTGCVDIGAKGEMAAVVFHLANFRHYVGSIVTSGSASRSARVHIRGGGWEVTIDAIDGIAAKIDTLRGEGGYAITHVGRLVRADGRSFSVDEARTALKALGQLLSFARGDWCMPVLPVGTDADGRVVWREWGVPRLASWRVPLSWFRDEDPAALDRAFPELLRLWSNDMWRPYLRRILYTYIAANGHQTDVGIVLGALVKSRGNRPFRPLADAS